MFPPSNTAWRAQQPRRRTGDADEMVASAERDLDMEGVADRSAVSRRTRCQIDSRHYAVTCERLLELGPTLRAVGAVLLAASMQPSDLTAVVPTTMCGLIAPSNAAVIHSSCSLQPSPHWSMAARWWGPSTATLGRPRTLPGASMPYGAWDLRSRLIGAGFSDIRQRSRPAPDDRPRPSAIPRPPHGRPCMEAFASRLPGREHRCRDSVVL